VNPEDLDRLRVLLEEHPELLEKAIAQMPSSLHRRVCVLLYIGAPIEEVFQAIRKGGREDRGWRHIFLKESLQSLWESLIELVQENL